MVRDHPDRLNKELHEAYYMDLDTSDIIMKLKTAEFTHEVGEFPGLA